VCGSGHHLENELSSFFSVVLKPIETAQFFRSLLVGVFEAVVRFKKKQPKTNQQKTAQKTFHQQSCKLVHAEMPSALQKKGFLLECSTFR